MSSGAPADSPQPEKKARNALDQGMKENLWETVLKWYQDKLDTTDEDITEHPLVKHMAGIIFKKVTVPIPADYWRTGAADDSASSDALQPAASMVGSLEYTALKVKETIEVREKFLESKGLPLDTVMNNDLIQEFLIEQKEAFKRLPYQQMMVEEDKVKKKRSGFHSRWSRELQRRCGSAAFWYMVSYTGRFNPSALKLGKAPQTVSSVQKSEQKAKTQRAIELRSRYKQGEKYANIRKESGANDFDNHSLRVAANDATRASGHGRIYNADGTYVDIGGSTGGYYRAVATDYVPPDNMAMDIEGAGEDASQLPWSLLEPQSCHD